MWCLLVGIFHLVNSRIQALSIRHTFIRAYTYFAKEDDANFDNDSAPYLNTSASRPVSGHLLFELENHRLTTDID